MLPLRLLAVVFTGASQALISPPLNWTLLHWISWIPLFWALEGVSAKRRFWLGWLCGFSALVSIFHWLVGTVQRFSNLPLVLAILILVLFSLAWGAYAGFFALYYPRIKRWAGPWWPFAVAALLVALEFVNPQLFPFYQGVAHYQNSMLFQVTSLTGVRGMSFLVLLVNGLAWAAIECLWYKHGAVDKKHLIRLSGITALILISICVYGAIRLKHISKLEQEAPVLRVGLVQLGMGIEDRSRRLREDRLGVLEEYMQESRDAADQGAQVVVWPEGASPYRVSGRGGRKISTLAREEKIEVWFGGMTVTRNEETREREYYNSAFRYDSGGTLDSTYHKIILLPFGEFMPGRNLVPKLADKIEGVGNFTHGKDVVVYDTPWVPFNYLICYEAIRNGLVRKNVKAGSRLFVTITNDAWFGNTSCPSQHLMLAAIRCAEHGIPMVRVATTGKSAVVDTRGKLVAQTDAFTKELLVEDVALVYAPTLYTKIGDVFSWACLAISLFGLGWLWRKERRAPVEDRPAGDPGPAAEPSRKKKKKKKKGRKGRQAAR